MRAGGGAEAGMCCGLCRSAWNGLRRLRHYRASCGTGCTLRIYLKSDAYYAPLFRLALKSAILEWGRGLM